MDDELQYIVSKPVCCKEKLHILLYSISNALLYCEKFIFLCSVCSTRIKGDSMKKYLVALLFLAQAPLASAAIVLLPETTVYYTKESFLAHLQPGYYLTDFSSYGYGDPLDGSQTSQTYGPVNGYSWTASARNGLYSLPGFLSTIDPTKLITITFPVTGNPVTAVGGIFASTDFDGNVIQQLVTVTLNDGTTASLTGQGFLGFTSTTPITWLTINGIDDPDDNYPAFDFDVGSAAIPEPVSLALLGLGGLLLAPWCRYTHG